MSAKRIIKVLTICCFVLIVVALFVAWNSPSTGYESSIYKAAPLLVWIFLLFSAACGMGIIVHQVYTKQHETSRLWALGLLLILFSYTAILSMHIIRGYYFWSIGDAATHVGEIKNIISTGHTGIDNFYPVMHVFSAQLSQICGLEPELLAKGLPVFFALIYVAFMYLLAKCLLPSKGAVILATVASLAPLSLRTYLHLVTNSLGNLLFPMALFLLIKSLTTSSWRWRALFILTVFLFPVLHPVPSVALAVVLVTIPLAKFVFQKVARSGRKIFDSGVKFSLVALAVLFAWEGGWISSFSVTGGVAQSLFAESYSIPELSPTIVEPEPSITESYPRPELYTLETAPAPSRIHCAAPIFARLIDDLRYAQTYGHSAMKHIFNLFGAVFLYIVLALIALPILWRRIRAQPNLRNLVSLYGPLAGIALLIMALYFTAFGFSPLRLLPEIVLICTIFVGFVLYELVGKARASPRNRFRPIAPVLVAIILIAAFGSGVAKVYESPWILADNDQATHTEIAGMNWFFDNKNRDVAVCSHCFALGRFADFLLNEPEQSEREDIPVRIAINYPPPHFGYHKRAWLGEYYTDDVYLVLGERDRLRYVEVYPKLAKYRFYPSDFERLEGDPTVDKLYSSGGLDVYYINGRAL